MFKFLTAVILSLLFSQNVKASPADTSVFFYKNSGLLVNNKDSADFFRIILPPDNDVDKELYRVQDFYINGKKKMVATSLTSSPNPTFDGMAVYYFPNGRRKTLASFQNGRLKNITNYYPNGKIYNILNFSLDSFNNNISEVQEWCDSTGVLLVVNGKGHVIIFNDDFTKMEQQGDIVKNRFEGDWQGSIGDTARYVCTFRRGVLKSGVTYLKSGQQYHFKSFNTLAVFNDGTDASFYNYIQRHLVYPDVEKKHKITGTVRLAFIIEADGRITNVKVTSGIMPSLDNEAIRVISSAPIWIPATRFGIPVKQLMTAAAYF